jgi:hypothetical protein
LRFQRAGLQFAHLPYFLGAFRVHPEQKTSAHMASLGVAEIAALRRKYLGHEPSEHEIRKQVWWFLCRHLLEHARMHIVNGFGVQ